jgi:hypothetical protein
MTLPGSLSIRSAARWTAAALLLAGATGAAFAAWEAKGPDMFVAMIQSGLSWCF